MDGSAKTEVANQLVTGDNSQLLSLLIRPYENGVKIFLSSRPKCRVGALPYGRTTIHQHKRRRTDDSRLVDYCGQRGVRAGRVLLLGAVARAAAPCAAAAGHAHLS